MSEEMYVGRCLECKKLQIVWIPHSYDYLGPHEVDCPNKKCYRVMREDEESFEPVLLDLIDMLKHCL